MSAAKIVTLSALASTGLPPRGLSLEQSAAYLGVSVNLFERLVADGQMPAAKRLGGRKLWDRIALDRAFAAIPDENGKTADADQWDRAAL